MRKIFNLFTFCGGRVLWMHTHKWLGETGQRKESERREIHSETEGNKERRGKINELKSQHFFSRYHPKLFLWQKDMCHHNRKPLSSHIRSSVQRSDFRILTFFSWRRSVALFVIYSRCHINVFFFKNLFLYMFPVYSLWLDLTCLRNVSLEAESHPLKKKKKVGM